jgi:hypothetical protein
MAEVLKRSTGKGDFIREKDVAGKGVRAKGKPTKDGMGKPMNGGRGASKRGDNDSDDKRGKR